MSDEHTLATEVRITFQRLAKEPNRQIAKALADLVDTEIGSIEFYQTLAALKSKCDQLTLDIQASRLKKGSKGLYVGAVETLADYLSLDSLKGNGNSQLRAEKQAFEYLVLVDDFLDPVDNRDVPDDFLDDLTEKAHAMLKGLAESGVDARLKAFLEKQINQFLWSIQTFNIVGIEGLTRAWGAMAAEIARSQGMTGAKKEEAKAWYKQALPVLGAIGLAVTSVSATVEQADNLLTHGEHIVAVVTGAEHTDKPEEGKEETSKEAAGKKG